MKSGPREVGINLALSVVSVVLLAGSLEAWSRWRERGRPQPPEVASYIQDWRDWHDDFYTVKSTAVGSPPWEDYNHEGLRDREHAAEKPPGTRRLVCLGDSTTLGWGLRPEEAYPQVLQDLLDGVGERWEVLNVALPGWSTRQEAIAYRRIARRYAPDLVLLGICLNDIPEMQNNLTRPPAWLAALNRRSALVRGLVRAREREIADVEELLARPDAPVVNEAFARLFAEVRVLRADVERDGARLAVLVFPFAEQVDKAAPPPSAQRRIVRFCAAEGLPALDLLPALAGVGPSAFLDYDHFSAEGAREVAEAVLESGLAGEANAEDRSRPLVVAVGAEQARLPPALLAWLRDSDAARRRAAVRALGTMGGGDARVADEVAARLDDAEPSVRTAAAWAAGAQTARAIPALVRELHDRDPHGRAGAAWALGRIGPPAHAAQGDLAAALEDAQDEVRWRAGVALGRVGPDADVLPRLIALVAARGSPARAPAAEAIGRIGEAAAGAVPTLVDALGDPREDVRWHAVWALGRIGPAAGPAVRALVALLADAGLRWRVADALGSIGPAAAAAVPGLQAALEDTSESVRWRAAQALGGIGRAASPAADALARATRDASGNVRLASVHSLGDVGADPSVLVPVLVRAFDDPDRRVRHEAENVVGRLGRQGRPAVPALVARLRDDDGGVRAGAARALGRIGSAPPAAREALRVLLADPDERARVEAQRALVVLGAR